MSLTEEQKAFQTRKMKTRFTQMDINGDGYISVEDYRELEKRFIEYGKLSGEAEQRLRKQIQVLVSCSDYSIIKYLLLLYITVHGQKGEDTELNFPLTFSVYGIVPFVLLYVFPRAEP